MTATGRQGRTSEQVHLRIMKLGRLLAAPILSAIVAGCMPNAVSYYRPAVEGGKLSTPICVPTESLMDFTLGSSHRLPVRVLADDGPHVRQVAVFFKRGSWQRFRFVSTDFRIRDLDKQVTIRPAAVRLFTDKGIEPLTTAPFVLPTTNKPVLIHMQITLPGRMPDRFEVLSPDIVIDGEQMPFPLMRFERKTWMGISPMNC
ncbi:MAG: hypothetical protein P8076_11305 [Gammaproteobacteria bacterium]